MTPRPTVRRRRLGALAGAATLLAVACPSVASAAISTIGPVGSGAGSSLAVSPDGKGHVASYGGTSSTTTVDYCRVPAGGGPCETKTSLSFPFAGAHQSGRSEVVVGGSTVAVYAGCFACTSANDASDRLYEWTSTNGGTTFGAPVQVHTGDAIGVNGYESNQGVALGTTPTSLFVYPSGNSVFASSNPATTNKATIGTGSGYSAVAPFGSTKLLATREKNGGVESNVFTDPNAGGITATEVTTAANWSAPAIALTNATYPRVAGGALGTALVYFDQATKTLRAVKFNGTGFGAPVQIADAAHSDFNVDRIYLSASTSGRLDLVWSDDGLLRYASSSDGGASWTTPTRLRNDGNGGSALRVAANASGAGFDLVSGGTEALTIQPLSDAGPDVDPAPPATPVTPVTPVKPVTPVVPVTPPKKDEPDLGLTTTASVPGGTLVLAGPKQCVAKGSKFAVRLTIKKKAKSKSGRTVVKITRADFYAGTKRVAVDKKAPFTQRIAVSAKARSGSQVVAKVKGHIKVSKGKKRRTKTLQLKIKVC